MRPKTQSSLLFAEEENSESSDIEDEDVFAQVGGDKSNGDIPFVSGPLDVVEEKKLVLWPPHLRCCSFFFFISLCLLLVLSRDRLPSCFVLFSLLTMMSAAPGLGGQERG